MMDKKYNAYLMHYQLQDGGGIPVFHGVRYQRGSGWFSRIIGSIGNLIKGIAPSVARKALPSAIGLAQDIVAGENVGQSTLNRLKQAGKDAAEETLEQLKQRLQSGQGIPNSMLRKLMIRKRKNCKSNLNFGNIKNKKKLRKDKLF